MADSTKIVTAALLLIGNELLSGRTQDANLNYLARQLTAMGIRLAEARVVADGEAEIVQAVNELRARYDYVFTTGGIGPTHDDITCECVAKAFGRRYVLNPQAQEILEDYYDGSGRELNEARLRMAYTPEGAELVDNPISKAPGFRVENVIVMAGIPAVMRAMFEAIAPKLEGGSKVISRSVSVLMGEGDIARPLGELQARNEGLEIGSYPFVRKGKFGTTLVLRGVDQAAVDAAAEELRTILKELGGSPEDEAAVSDGSWPRPEA
ncbi:MAG: molybdopterin-binding protein [Proteobacteria bacterium]|nr:molybdopterin-binding protein [Pseudomonadota bacterium]MDA1357218.1 molybdopterin-binding protein [Pseudomonadota bacterium]